MMSNTTWIRQGHAMDTIGTRISHIKSEELDKIQHDTLPILTFPVIIDENTSF